MSNGCQVTPIAYERETVAYDNNDETAGIIGFSLSGGLEITQSARDRYNDMVKRHGQELIPPIQKDFGIKEMENGCYDMTLEASEKWRKMILIEERIK